MSEKPTIVPIKIPPLGDDGKQTPEQKEFMELIEKTTMALEGQKLIHHVHVYSAVLVNLANKMLGDDQMVDFMMNVIYLSQQIVDTDFELETRH